MSRRAAVQDPILPRVAYTAQEVSEMLGINRVTIYRLIREGKLPASRISERAYRITQEDIDAFLANKAGDEDKKATTQRRPHK